MDTAAPLPVDPMALAAERIDDLLTMLGVDPNERQVEDVHGIDTPMGPTIKEVIAGAAVKAYREAQEVLDHEGYNPPGTVASVRVRPQHHAHPWHSVTIRTINYSQSAYADTKVTYEATFTGGSPANTPGVEIPFATHPPFNRELHESGPGVTIKRFPPRSIEELEEDHYSRIKNIIRALISGGWEADCSRPGEHHRGMSQTYLERFEHVSGSRFENTYRIVIVKPNMS